jgi:hypothetical protein
MDAKQFAWLYLVQHGQAGVKKEYYGGHKICDSGAKSIPCPEYGNFEPIKQVYLKQIKAYGVNWQRTAPPTSESIYIFNGTFADNSEEEALTGILTLSNGTTQTWTAEALEVSNVFEMMALAHEAEVKFKEIF